MIIKYNGLNLYECEGVKLFPGNNEVSKIDFEKACKNRWFVARLDSGVIDVLDDGEAFNKKAPAACKKIVKDIFDVAKLKKLLENEHRESVKGAIQEQLNMIESYGS